MDIWKPFPKSPWSRKSTISPRNECSNFGVGVFATAPKFVHIYFEPFNLTPALRRKANGYLERTADSALPSEET